MFRLEGLPTKIRIDLIRAMRMTLSNATENQSVTPEKLKDFAETIVLIEREIPFQVQLDGLFTFRDMLALCEGEEAAKDFTDWVALKTNFSVLGS